MASEDVVSEPVTQQDIDDIYDRLDDVLETQQEMMKLLVSISQRVPVRSRRIEIGDNVAFTLAFAGLMVFLTIIFTVN